MCTNQEQGAVQSIRYRRSYLTGHGCTLTACLSEPMSSGAKIKCDGTRPSCGQCERLSQDCSYDRRAKKRFLTVEYIDVLEDRLAAIESMLRQANGIKHGNDDASRNVPKSKQKHVRTHPNSVNATGPSPYSDLNGADHESVSDRSTCSAMLTGLTPTHAFPPSYPHIATTPFQRQTEAANGASPTGTPTSADIYLPVSSPQKSHNLVSRPTFTAIREDLFNLFFEYVYPLFIPMQLQDSPIYWRTKALNSVFLTNAMYCTSLRYTSYLDPRYRRHTAGDLFFFEARALLDSELDCPSSTTVFASARRSLGRTYFTICHRLCSELRLGMEADPNAPGGLPPPYEQEINRRLFWSLWTFENYGSSIGRRSSYFATSDCRVALPQICKMDSVNDPSNVPDLLSIKVMSSSDLYIPALPTSTPEGYLLMLEKTLVNIISNSPVLGSLCTSVSPEVQQYQQIIFEDSLKSWKNNLPEWLPFSESENQSIKPLLGHPSAWLLVYIRLVYYFSVTLLYRANIMCEFLNPIATRTPQFEKAKKAATTCFSLISQILQYNPEFLHLGFFTCYIVFHVGWVHAAFARLAQDEAETRRHWSYVDLHMTALKHLGRYWGMPAMQYAVLRHFRFNEDSAILIQRYSTVIALNPLASCSAEELEGFLIPHHQIGARSEPITAMQPAHFVNMIDNQQQHTNPPTQPLLSQIGYMQSDQQKWQPSNQYTAQRQTKPAHSLNTQQQYVPHMQHLATPEQFSLSAILQQMNPVNLNPILDTMTQQPVLNDPNGDLDTLKFSFPE
ncbi:hypothetical protein BDEG_21785 [Batrachochytrium dendrobatidis JEL423]|uniref:Zn(2)-C6 fungal-type domain-containing protein n=1 Tax=Batrachochytrium dendrobatidis (strain JEL423) TaxID=403673 RepID=A0A177WDG9_BATDL|nr:hypothetical protein BDEG_21785 [Batrachochytrium dendrobatidis JEL423]